jgi:DNA-binding beta-propeller fold protein YncE
MTVLRLLVLALLALPVAAASAKGDSREVAFVAAEDDDQLVAVELRTARVLRRIHIASGPHNVAAAGTLGPVLVTSPPANRVTLVDVRRLRVAHVFELSGSPHDVEVSPDVRHAYVTLERAARVAVIDLRARRVVRLVPVPAGPHDLAVHPHGHRVWVTHGPDARSMTVLDTSRPGRPRIARRVPARGAHDIAVACSGRCVWVTYWDSGTIGAYDSGSGRLLRRVRAGELVHHVQAAPPKGGRYIWTTDHVGDRARLLEAQSGRILRTFRVGAGPHHVAPSPAAPGGRRVVVASHDAGTISILTPEGRTERYRTRSIPTGHGLHGVAVVLLP